MSIQFSRSIQPLLIGSVVVLSLACRDDERARSNETGAIPSERTRTSQSPAESPRTSQSAPSPGAFPEQRLDSPDLNRERTLDERMPVAGRDEIELGSGGKGGASGKGGSGGSKH